MKASVTNIGSTWPPNTINLPASPPRAELTRSVDKVEDDERLPHVDRIGNATEPVVDLVLDQARNTFSLERKWAWRTWLEPRRLLWRYLTTNPRALYLLFNRGRSESDRGLVERKTKGGRWKPPFVEPPGVQSITHSSE